LRGRGLQDRPRPQRPARLRRLLRARACRRPAPHVLPGLSRRCRRGGAADCTAPAVPLPLVPQGHGIRKHSPGPVHPRRAGAGCSGVDAAHRRRGGPGARSYRGGRRDPENPCRRLRARAAGFDRHLPELVRLPARSGLPLWGPPSRVSTEAPTEEQRGAIEAGPDGAFLIAAGPGTGKTYTMVQRFRWLVERHAVQPEAILAVTFTEAAATELRVRLTRELERPLDDAWIGTFHGVCARLLREEAYLVGIPREIRVLDEIGQRLLVERLQARLRSGAEPGLDRDFEALNPDEVNDLIKHGPTFALKLKGRGVRADEFRRRALEIHSTMVPTNRDAPNSDPSPGGPKAPTLSLPARAELEAIEVLHTIYSTYESWLAQAGRMDFDDLILAVIQALEDVPEFQERCRQRFRYVLVDEFQDT